MLIKINQNQIDKFLLEQNHFKKYKHADSTYFLKLLGFAFLEGEEIHEEQLFQAWIDESVIKVNGNFSLIIINEETCELTVITDRFGSQPLYYHQTDTSIYLAENIFEIIENKEELCETISKERIFEFIIFQRLFNFKTLSTQIHKFKSATIMKWSPNSQTKSVRFWTPPTSKLDINEEQAAIELGRLIKASYQLYTKNKKTLGLLLSGGLDSRAILCVAENNVHCMTLGPFENKEFKVAQKLSHHCGLKHTFIKRSDKYYFEKRKESIRLGSGAQNIFHSHFYTLEKSPHKPDLLLHGHGFDYFFQGSYMPLDRVYFAGKSTLHHKVHKVNDLKIAIFEKLKYRLKSKIIRDLIVDYDNLVEHLENQLENIINEAKELGILNVYDQWEYFNSHDLGSHYTALNLRSMESFANQRCIAWENELFDFYWKMPSNWRLDAKVFKKALALLNFSVASEKNANINLPANIPTKTQSYLYFIGQALSKMGFKSYGLPTPEERSWPNFSELLKTDENWKSELNALYMHSNQSSFFSTIIDIDKLSQLIHNYSEESENHSSLLFSLLTVNYALQEANV